MVQYGILVVSHGSRDPEWVRWVDEAVAGMQKPEGVPVECGFLELVAGRLIQDGIDRLEHQGVTDLIVIPLFASSGSTHVDEISWAFGVKAYPVQETELEPFRVQANIHWCSPLDDCPEAVQLVTSLAMELSEEPEREMVVIVAHGSQEAGFYERWRSVLQSLAVQVQQLGGFAAVDYAMLLPDQLACRMKGWTARYPERVKLVVPLFLSPGYFTKQVIPSRLKGLSYKYNGRAMLPNPLISQWLTRQAARFFE